MADALPMVKKMVTNLVESGSKVPTWVLTNFNDPNVELEVNTPDVEELKSSMNELKYGGGDDLREQVLKGKRRFLANWVPSPFFEADSWDPGPTLLRTSSYLSEPAPKNPHRHHI